MLKNVHWWVGLYRYGYWKVLNYENTQKTWDIFFTEVVCAGSIFLWYITVISLTFSCSLFSNVWGLGLHRSWQNLSMGCLCMRRPWKFQIQYALSTLCPHQLTPTNHQIGNFHAKHKKSSSFSTRLSILYICCSNFTSCVLLTQNAWKLCHPPHRINWCSL